MGREKHLKQRLRKTLDELEGVEWGPPTYDSYLVTTCHRLRTVPIGDFSTEDLRIMIGQQIGLLWLVPLALAVVEEDPLAEGFCYPGDLLAALLRVEPEHWARQRAHRKRLETVVESMDSLPREVEEYLPHFRGDDSP